MTPEMALLGSGAMTVLALSMLSARRQYNVGVDNMACAAILAAGWAYVYLGEMWFPARPPPPYQPAPLVTSAFVVDGLSAAIIAWLAYTRPAKWKTALFSLLVVQIATEAAFWGWVVIHNGETPRGLLYYRALTGNVLYALQLFCVGWAGASHAFLGRIAGESADTGGDRQPWPPPVGAP